VIHLTVQQLSSALDGALGGPSLELVVRHLARCHECRDRQARLARFDDALRRLLAQDPHEFFLDDLGKRSESIVVAVARGLPVPPMVTSLPLIDDEDPYEEVEPPLPTRPELGRAAEIARDAGFGRIGLKPTAPAQAPAADPEQAERLLEALSGGDTADFEELTAREFGAGAEDGGEPDAADESRRPDGPTFDLPAWAKEGSPHGRRGAPGPRVVRAIPKLQMMFERLDERAANLSHGAVAEVFRKDPEPPASEPAGSTPGVDAETTSPVARQPEPGPEPVAPAVPADPAAVAPGAIERFPDAYTLPVTEAYELVNELHDATSDEGGPFVDERHERRGRQVGLAARLRSRPPAPRSRMPLAIALTSVAVLAALVAVLQFAPPAPTDGTASAVRAPRLPRVEFVGLDSSAVPTLPAMDPDLRLATTPAPVESLVGTSSSPPAPAPADSGAATPPADTLGRNPGR
jgi:hypothetical protein